MVKEKKVFSPETLETFAANLLTAVGARAEDAAVVAESLVYADLRGVSSHGFLRLEQYLKRAEAGRINLKASMPLLRESPATALMDAELGFGQVAGVKAVDIAVRKAAAVGVGVVSVKNSNHFGAAAFFAARATANNMAAVVLTNASPAMPPYNGTKAVLGTNPFCAAVPVADGEPVILDMSTSEVAKGKIRRALANGERIPPGWAVDKDGKPTTDPAAALEGFVCPMSGPKGSGLSLMIDILSGVFSGSTLTGGVGSLLNLNRDSNTGHMVMVLNPEFFSGTDRFIRDTAAVARDLRGQEAADGNRVFLPGDIEAETMARNRENGVAVNADLADAVNAHAARLGVAPLREE